jgi:hypothetical protein
MSLADRQRKHEQTHQRTLEQQILDALLRIEELLQKPEVAPVEDVKPAVKKAQTQQGVRKVDRL